MDKMEIDRIKAAVMANLGNNAILTVQKGRNKKVVLPVRVENAHPNVFTVKVDEVAAAESNTPRRFSFTYIDVLTNSVELNFKAAELRSLEGADGSFEATPRGRGGDEATITDEEKIEELAEA